MIEPTGRDEAGESTCHRVQKKVVTELVVQDWYSCIEQSGFGKVVSAAELARDLEICWTTDEPT
jgi:phosphosulfolactate phosphohydrolase-like enzyme